MRSIKIKLMSLIAMICLVMGIMIVGIFSAQTQQIKLNGQVNFEIGDKSLYVKDVRLQENTDSSPYSLSEQGRFLPGYINGNFNMNLGDFTNSYGSFALYFDIINTMDETTEETFSYTVKPSTTQSGVTVSSVILDSNGSTVSQIPQGTVKPSEVTSLTPISATIKVTVSSTAGVSVNLNNITITINQYVPQVYDYFTFEVNSDGTTVTLTDYDSSLSDTTDIVIPATVLVVDGVWMDGNDYTVTAIASASPSSDGVFSNSGITSIELPSTLEMIGNYAFEDCSGIETLEYKGTIDQWLSIDFGAYCMEDDSHTFIVNGEELTNLVVPEGVTSIGNSAFYGCSGLTSIDLPSSLEAIGDSAFYGCSALTKINYNAVSVSDLSEYDNGVFGYAGQDVDGITVNFGEGVKHIPNSLFVPTNTYGSPTSRTPNIKVVNFSSTVTSIGEYTFSNCSGLTSINLSNCTSLTSIGDYAFSWCSGLTSIDLSNCTSLTSIGSNAFKNCSGLTSITFPNTTGWYRTASSTATSGTNMIMSDPEQNAEWLTETYYNYYFKRNA